MDPPVNLGLVIVFLCVIPPVSYRFYYDVAAAALPLFCHNARAGRGPKEPSAGVVWCVSSVLLFGRSIRISQLVAACCLLSVV